MNRLVSRSLLVALVFCFVFSPVVYGQGGAAASKRLTTSIWDLIAYTWNALSNLAGSSLDPFGTPNSDAGSDPDPCGNPSTSDSDAGSHLDPFGKP